MATALDITGLESFSLLFSFLFVLVIVFAFLSYSKFLGDNKAIHALIALFIAIFTLFSSNVVNTITRMAPWFVLLFIFTLFMIMSFKVFGTSDSAIMDVVASPEYRYIIWWVVAIGIVIGVSSLTSTVWEEGAPSYNDSSKGGSSDVGSTGASAFWDTLFHPKVLGLALIFLIALFTIQKMTAT